MKLLILNENVMKSIMSMNDAIDAVKEAAIEYVNGNAHIPLRTNINVKENNGDSLYMYGYVKGTSALGVKLVSVFPDNKDKGISSCPSTMILEDATTGMVKCIMDGTYLTRLRTGALSGAATDFLSRKNSSIYAQIGVGGQARCQLHAILAVRDIKEIYIFSRTKDSAEKFCADMKKELMDTISSFSYATKEVPQFIACSPRDDVIRKADIITAVTTSENPVFDFSNVKVGCHINAVGSYTPTMSEIPEEVVLHASKIIVDTLDGTISESGDFIKPIKKGLFNKEMITAELGDLVSGKCDGRKDEKELTLFEATGSAVYDLVTAEKVYRLAVDKGLGTIIDM